MHWPRIIRVPRKSHAVHIVDDGRHDIRLNNWLINIYDFQIVHLIYYFRLSGRNRLRIGYSGLQVMLIGVVIIIRLIEISQVVKAAVHALACV